MTYSLILNTLIFILLYSNCASSQEVTNSNILIEGKYESINGDYFEFQDFKFKYYGFNDGFYDGNSDGIYEQEDKLLIKLKSSKKLIREYDNKVLLNIKPSKSEGNFIRFSFNKGLVSNLKNQGIFIALDVHTNGINSSSKNTFIMNSDDNEFTFDNSDKYSTKSFRIRIYSDLLFYGETSFSSTLFFNSPTYVDKNIFHVEFPKIDIDFLKYIYINEELALIKENSIVWRGKTYVNVGN